MMIQVRINSFGREKVDIDVSEVVVGRDPTTVLHLDGVDSKTGIDSLYHTLKAQFVKP